jgi:NTE family protein
MMRRDAVGGETGATDLRIGLALGSGGARGAAHTGVLNVLDREAIPISFVSGSSIGALVGAAYAVGLPVEQVEREWLVTDVHRLFRSFLPTFPRAGLSSGSELRKILTDVLGDERIEDLPIPYAAVACDIDTGETVVLREGPLVDAVRASTAIPGIFHPVRWGDRLLIDGGLVDPVPVRTCRDLGAEFVIAVDITPRPVPTTQRGRNVWDRIGDQLREGLTHQAWIPNSLTELLESLFRERPERPLPGLYSILNQSISILVQEILRQKLASHPPDLLIRPELSLSFMSYLQAREGIEAGERAAEDALPELRRRLQQRRGRRIDRAPRA